MCCWVILKPSQISSGQVGWVRFLLSPTNNCNICLLILKKYILQIFIFQSSKKKNSINYIRRTYSIDYNRKKWIILWETTIVVCLNFRVGVSDTFMSVNFILRLFWPLRGSTQQGPFHYFSKVCHFVLRLFFVWLHLH